MFEKDAEEYVNEHSEYDETFDMVFVNCETKKAFQDGAEFGYNKAKEETEYARTIIQDLLDNSDEYARQRAYEFLDRPCAKCKHKAKMLTDKKPCKDCDNGCNWEK